MSMNGEYLRVRPAELGWALGDSAWAWSLSEAAQELQEESRPSPAEARHFTTHKTWHLLAFLTRRAGFPVDLVHGEEPAFTDDWGYGPPRLLTPAQVALAADALHRTSYDQLIRGVDPAELTRAEIYPQIWDAPASLEWARDFYTALVAFFRAAASAGDAVLVWID
ncbi:YfbM family protein [Streptomyces albidoflavus]|uniref:YfbM family protein n=1 Tax=Streptomyces albidoflavus TaxID=1886 RepID=UPI0033BAC5CC